jgi:hypothetical protein
MTTYTEIWPQTEPLRTLDELIEHYAEELDRNGGDLEAIPEIAALLAFDEDAFHEQLERLGLKVLELKADAEAVKIERVRLEVKERRWTKAADAIKGYMKRMLSTRKDPKYKTPRVTISLVNNGGNPSVRAASEEKLEELYQTGSPFVESIVTYRLKVDEILAAHKAGDALPEGIIVERGKHVRIA